MSSQPNDAGIPDHQLASLPLSEAQLAQYRRDGFLVLPGGLARDEVDALRSECRRLWSVIDSSASSPRVQRRETLHGGITTDRIDPVLDMSPAFQRLAADARLVRLAAQVLGALPAVFKVKLISKWPGTTGYKMHQDYTYWSFVGNVPPDHFVNVLVALNMFDGESGGTEMFPGLHDRRLAGPPDSPNDVDEALIDLRTGVVLNLDPGDLALFHGLTPHRSGPNRATHRRESLFITYVHAADGDLYGRYYADRPSGWIEPR